MNNTYKAIVKDPSTNSRLVIRVKDRSISSATEQVQKAIRLTKKFYQIQSITRMGV